MKSLGDYKTNKASLAKSACLVVLYGWCSVASAALSYSYTGSQAIPDNNGSGVAFAFSLADSATSIASVSVTLNLSGGYNGDLYAYLAHDAGGYAVLLNRTGVGSATPGSSALGYANAGFSITLSSMGSANVHFYQNNSPSYDSSGRLTGTWQPDGRDIDPGSPAANFDAPGTADFGSFTGANPNGNWTVYFADLSPGGISTVNGFTVDVIAVPEPVNAALGLFAGLGSVFAVFRWQRARRLRQHSF